MKSKSKKKELCKETKKVTKKLHLAEARNDTEMKARHSANLEELKATPLPSRGQNPGWI